MNRTVLTTLRHVLEATARRIDAALDPPSLGAHEDEPKRLSPAEQQWRAIHDPANASAIEDLFYSRPQSRRLNRGELVLWEANGGMQTLLAKLGLRQPTRKEPITMNQLRRLTFKLDTTGLVEIDRINKLTEKAHEIFTPSELPIFESLLQRMLEEHGGWVETFENVEGVRLAPGFKCDLLRDLLERKRPLPRSVSANESFT